jgi:hypothetical protein
VGEGLKVERELVEAVATRSAAGEAFLRIVEDRVRSSSLVEVLAEFTSLSDAESS